MSNDGFAIDSWEFRVKSEDLGGHGVYALVATSDGDEYLIGEAWTREVAGHIVQVHNATLDTDPVAAAERRGFSEGAESQREANAKALRDLAAMFAPASAMRSHLESAAEHLSSLPLVGVTRKDSTDE